MKLSELKKLISEEIKAGGDREIVLYDCRGDEISFPEFGLGLRGPTEFTFLREK
jgi:hypothetical protein